MFDLRRYAIMRHRCQIQLLLATWCYLSIALTAALSRAALPGATAMLLIHILSVVLLIVLSVYTLLAYVFYKREENFKAVLVNILLTVYVVLFLSTIAFVATVSPISGWDFLSYWGPAAVDSMSSDSLAGSHQYPYERDKHPWIITEFTAVYGSYFKTPDFNAYLWLATLVIYVAGVQATGGFINSKLIHIFFAILLSCFPLFENHLLYTGYTETSLACGLFLCYGNILLGVKNKSKIFYATALAVLLTLPLIKTSGAVLVAALVAGGISAHLSKELHAVRTVFAFIVCAIVLLGITVYLNDGAHVSFLKTGTEINAPDFVTLFNTLFHAYFYNSSFGVLPLFIAIVFMQLVAGTTRGAYLRLQRSIAFFWIGYLAFCVLFLFTDYGLGHALPGSDTSFSRMHIPLGGSIAMMLLLMLSPSESSNYSNLIARHDNYSRK